MSEYLNLLNRLHEGVIVLDNNEDEDSIKFCSEEAIKILTPALK